MRISIRWAGLAVMVLALVGTLSLPAGPAEAAGGRC